MKILFLSRWYPHPADNGSKLRILNLIKELAREHEISLVAFAGGPVAMDQLQFMRSWCVNVQVVQYVAFQPDSLKARLGSLSLKPRSVVSTDSAEMHATARNEARRLKPDLVIASEIDMLPYARELDAVRMIEDLELGVIYQTLTTAKGARKARAWLTWAKLNTYVRTIARSFQGCTVVSNNELCLARQMTHDMPMLVVPNGVDVAACNAIQAQPAPDTIIYNGSINYKPNLDAVRYFVDEIFPRVLCKRPDVRLFVTGKVDGVPPAQLPKHDHLVWTGYVDDIMSRVAGSWLAVAPLRFGSGTRLKILESLALRTPVVCTSKGAEGLDLVDGEDALFADDPEKFANQVLKVLSDSTLRFRLAEHAAQTVSARFDWRVIGRELAQFACRIAGTAR